MPEFIRNRVRNPSAERDIVGYTSIQNAPAGSTGGSTSQVHTTADARHGQGCAEFAHTHPSGGTDPAAFGNYSLFPSPITGLTAIAANAGETWYIRGSTRIASASIPPPLLQLLGRFEAAGGIFITQTEASGGERGAMVNPPVGEWLDFDGFVTMPAGTILFSPRTQFRVSQGASYVLRLDRSMAVKVADPGESYNADELIEYFDGDSFGASWDGPSHASISLMEVDWNPTGREIYDGLIPLVEAYGDPDESLKVFCDGIGAMFAPIDSLSRDEGEHPGWSQALDLSRAHPDWLRWIAQWTGYYAPLEPASWETERERIITRSAHRRGGIDILREVVQEHLNSPKEVIIQERTTSAHRIHVYVHSSQIKTSAAAVEAAARSQKAAGLIMDFTVLTGADYNLLQASNLTYNELQATHTNYNSVLTNPGL